MTEYGVRHVGTAIAGGARRLTLCVTVPTYWTDQEVTRHMELAAKKFTSGRVHPFDGPEVFDDYELPGKESNELRGPALELSIGEIREPVSEEKLKDHPRILELLREKKRMLRRGGANE